MKKKRRKAAKKSSKEVWLPRRLSRLPCLKNQQSRLQRSSLTRDIFIQQETNIEGIGNFADPQEQQDHGKRLGNLAAIQKGHRSQFVSAYIGETIKTKYIVFSFDSTNHFPFCILYSYFELCPYSRFSPLAVDVFLASKVAAAMNILTQASVPMQPSMAWWENPPCVFHVKYIF